MKFEYWFDNLSADDSKDYIILPKRLGLDKAINSLINFLWPRKAKSLTFSNGPKHKYPRLLDLPVCVEQSFFEYGKQYG